MSHFICLCCRIYDAIDKATVALPLFTAPVSMSKESIDKKSHPEVLPSDMTHGINTAVVQIYINFNKMPS